MEPKGVAKFMLVATFWALEQGFKFAWQVMKQAGKSIREV